LYQWDFSPVLANAPLLVAGPGEHAQDHGHGAGVRRAAGPGAGAAAPVAAAVAALAGGLRHRVFRTTPPLVQLFWFFFALPILVQVEMTPFVAGGADLLDPVGLVLRRGVPRRHPVDRARPVGAGRAIGMTPRPGDAPHHPAAGGQAHDPGLHGARHRADEDDDAGGHRVLRRPAVPGQRGGAEDLPPAGGVHRRGAAVLRR
jgi:hypothetical protein